LGEVAQNPKLLEAYGVYVGNPAVKIKDRLIEIIV